jgi:hypothetical protein
MEAKKIEKKVKKTDIWMTEPEKHDYPAAEDFLTLLYGGGLVMKAVRELENEKTIKKKAKDIVRASGVSLLGISNGHIKKNLKKIKENKKLSPILLVVDNQKNKLIIADGYHRLCASYTISEDILVPCRIAYIN